MKYVSFSGSDIGILLQGSKLSLCNEQNGDTMSVMIRDDKAKKLILQALDIEGIIQEIEWKKLVKNKNIRQSEKQQNELEKKNQGILGANWEG